MNIVIKFVEGDRGSVAYRATALAVVALGAVTLAACSSSEAGAAGHVSVVASTNVYGDIARQVAGTLAGNRVQITSIISDPAADPHSYEASTRNLLEIKRADVIVENGGGYDDFVDTMRRSAGARATVLDAVDISGKKAAPGGDLNEHVWYDFPTVQKVANAIATALSAKDPRDAATFRTGARALAGRLHRFEARERAIKAAHRGTGVAITEPVPLYLLQACGLVDRTPPQFSHAVEDGTDVSPRVMQQTLALFSARRVKLLAYNEQTSGPETEQVIAAARTYGIAVVPVTETLPGGQDYLTWMGRNLTAVESALR
jgi:zinc/manganese transport system substrate-binding protein